MPNLSSQTKLKTRTNNFGRDSGFNENLHLVRLMWRSAFDQKSIFSAVLHTCASWEEWLSRSKCNQPNLTRSNAVLHMSQTQLIEFGSWSTAFDAGLTSPTIWFVVTADIHIQSWKMKNFLYRLIINGTVHSHDLPTLHNPSCTQANVRWSLYVENRKGL